MVKHTFIKILGPPILSAIKALEEVAVSMPDVCIMDTIITNEIPRSVRRGLDGRVMGRDFKRDPRIAEFAYSYYRSSGVVISRERCESIFSQSGASLGDYDFFFEWTKNITSVEYEEFIEKIDEKLSPLGCFYSIVN